MKKINPSDWVEITNLNTGYEVHDSLRMAVFSYSIDNSIVRFRGEVIRSLSTPAESNVVCVLPEKIRPKSRINLPISTGLSFTNEGSSYLILKKNGELEVVATTFDQQRYIRFCGLFYIV